jgi:poly(3-hydroxybutyrate) depolymerase
MDCSVDEQEVRGSSSARTTSSVRKNTTVERCVRIPRACALASTVVVAANLLACSGDTGIARPGTHGAAAGSSNNTETGTPAGAAGSTNTSTTTTPGGGVSGADQPAASAGVAADVVPSPGCGRNRTLQDGRQTMTSSGLSRSFYLKTPSAYNSSQPYRVVFMFHWNYGSSNAIVNPPDSDHNTDLPFYGLGDLAGDSTIFVVPQGLADTGGAGWANPNNRDVIFTDDMLAAVSADLCLDLSRVFTTGFSYGGAISYKLACVRSDKFRAAIVYDTGPVSGNNAAECTAPIAFFQSHGVDDGIFNYSQVGLGILNVFANVNGCTPTTPPAPAQDGHTCISLEGCSGGHPVRFCNFGAGENNPYNASLKGHYPSPKDPGESISWVPTEVWNFIKQF